MNTPTIREAYNILSQRFERAHSDAPSLCARVLISHVLAVDSVYLSANYQENISQKQWQNLNDLALRHEAGEPLAYITGYKEFYGRKFLVNSHTLIPRPESEDVLDAAFEALKTTAPRFVDIGTGSGCLGISLAAQRADASGILLDINSDALAVARENAKNLGVMEQVKLVRANLRHLPFVSNSFDLIISNPPYVSEGEYRDLLPNVRKFEPKSALVPKIFTDESDEHGLIYIGCIAAMAHDLLKNGGVCIVEHGYMQGEFVRKIFEKNTNWVSVKTGKDLAGLDRYCLCKKT